MCGVTGFLSLQQGESAEQVVGRMADSLRHRGPDDRGVWVDSAAGIALGHRRLSILDLSRAGHQPMVSGCERYVIAFNGEIYNHLALRKSLDATQGAIAWRGHSDTETLLACIATWGIEATLTKSVGMFAIALWDRETRVLTLARDRIGEKPMYYGWQAGTFLFGSELKALRAHPSFQAGIDRNVLALFLRRNYVPGPYSIYENVYKLPAGSLIQVRVNQSAAVPVAWWTLADVAERGSAAPFAGSEVDAVDTLERLLGSAVRGQMVADVPLGALLSGGLDSTLIAALMQANGSGAVRTFTVGFDERGYDESRQARAVAKHLGTEHTELRLRADDALALVPQLATMYDEPFADSSQLPTHLVMRLARQHVAVALSGDAGDEMFGGYNRYHHVPLLWERLGWMPETARLMLAAGLTRIPSPAINGLAELLPPQWGIAQLGEKVQKLAQRLRDLRSVDDLYVSLVSEWQQSDQIVLGGRVPSNLLDDRDRWPRLPDPVSRMMALDGLTYLPDDILVKVDRAAMAVGLETRAPFLDRDVVEFSWSLPMHMKLRARQGKWLVRRLLDRYVPPQLIDRPKMGFGIPLDAWLRGPLRPWAEHLLDEKRLRVQGYLDPFVVHRAWKAHTTGNASYGYRLWSVLMFQSWLEAAA